MHRDPQPAPGSVPPAPPRPRWWSAVLILAAAAFALLAIHLPESDDRQRQIVLTSAVVLFSFVLLLVWLLLFSRLAARARLGALVGLVVAALAFGALVDVRGLSGDLVPILEWRWSGDPDARGGAAADGAPVTPGGGTQVDALRYPQFLGPSRDATVDLALDPDWESAGPALLWRRPVGAGWSGFAIADGRAITLEQDGPREAVRAYAVGTGLPLWEHAIEARHDDPLGGIGPRSTPTIAEGAVYAYGGTGILRALDPADGRELWRRDVLADHGAQRPEYGVAASPLVHEGRVIVAAGGPRGGSLAAYDAASGERVWSGGDAPAAYSSPMLAELGGRTRILWLHDAGVSAHDPADGHVVWTLPWPAETQEVSQPVLLPGGRIFVSTGYGVGAALYRAPGTGDAPPERLWASRGLKAKFTNVVRRGEYLYGLDDGILVCLDAASGERRWKRGRYGHGQILRAGAHLLIVAEDGDLALVEATPEEYRELARMPGLRGKTWNHPALAGPILIVRNDREAAAFRLTLEAGPPPDIAAAPQAGR